MGFNKLYEENRLWDPNDDGYQDWLSSTRDEPDPTPLFSNKFNLDVFNNTFSDMKNKGGDGQIVKHDAPTALVSCGNGFTELDNTNQITDFTKLKIIGDVTCDVDGSVPSTIKSTTIENPNFYINKDTFEETSEIQNALAVMAVDNLPSELPRDSSKEFGNGIVNEVIPFILGIDDGRILNATITEDGRFLDKYSYLKDYIDSK